MSEHTPTPWYVSESVDIRRCPDSIVCTCNGYKQGSGIAFAEDVANAEYIVRACNGFPAMKKALETQDKLLCDLGFRKGYVEKYDAMEKAIIESITQLCGKKCSGFCACSECSRGAARFVLVAALAAGDE